MLNSTRRAKPRPALKINLKGEPGVVRNKGHERRRESDADQQKIRKVVQAANGSKKRHHSGEIEEPKEYG